MSTRSSHARRRRAVLSAFCWGLLAVATHDGLADEVVFVSDLGAGQACDPNSCFEPNGCGHSCLEPGCCEPSCCGDRWWLGADALLWRLSGSDLPALVTASPTGTALADAGVLGEPTTAVLAGGQEIGDSLRGGYRLYAGWWLDDCQRFALTGEYFDAGSDNYGFAQGADAALVVTRPFYNTQTDEADAQLVSALNELDGTVTVGASDEFSGAAVAGQLCLRRCCAPCSCDSFSLDLTGGYRHYQYNTGLAISENLTVLAGTSQPLVPGTTIELTDRFSTRNEFHGGEIGLKSRAARGFLWLDGMASLAIGANHRSVTINGSTLNTVPSVGSASFAGGLLTSDQTNIGYYSDTTTVVIPSFRLALGCQLSRRLSGHIGYNAIVWSNVVAAADQLPPGLEVDPRNLPPAASGGGAEPAFAGLADKTLVAHGLDLGLELTY